MSQLLLSGIPLGFSDCLEIPDMSGAPDLTRSGFSGSRPSQPRGPARCKDGLSPGFPAAPERDVYDHSALPVFPRHFRTFRIRFPKVPAEGKLRQVCRSFVSLIHMFPCCFLVRIWLLDLGFMFLVCLLTSSLGLRRFYVLVSVISPAAGRRHPHVCSMVK